MNFKPTTTRCCGHDFTLSSPATLADWITVLGEAACMERIFRMQCYTKANIAIRYSLRYDPKNPRGFTDTELAIATEKANKVLLEP